MAKDTETPQIYWTNWSHTYESPINFLFTPETSLELVSIVKEAYEENRKIRVLGSGHSLSNIAQPEEDSWVVSLEKYNNILNVDTQNQTITVQAGVTIEQINSILFNYDLALENLSSISVQTISGAIQTGTHGTGILYGPLHTQIVSLTVINGKGEHKEISPTTDPTLFRAYQCGLGSLGIIDTVTLRTVPKRVLHEKMYPGKWPEILDKLDELLYNNEYFRFFWFPYTDEVGIWTANPLASQCCDIQPGPLLALYNRNPYFHIATVEKFSKEMNDPSIQSLEDILEQGPLDPDIIALYNHALFQSDYSRTYERTDYSDRILNIDCGTHANCYALEVSVLIRYTRPFLLALQDLIEKNHYPAHTGIEVRFVKADNAYMSLAFSEDPNDLFCFVGIVSIRPNNKPIVHDPYFRDVQQLSEKYGGRSHWGKMGYYHPKRLQKTYPYFEYFKNIQRKEDPKAIFLNKMTRNIFTK